MRSAKVKVDDIVRVVAGPYQGMNGIIKSIDDKDQAKVSLRGLTTVKIPIMFLRIPK